MVTMLFSETQHWDVTTGRHASCSSARPGYCAKCVQENGVSYLSVTAHGDANDPRTDDIAGDVVANDVIQRDRGLRLIDANIAMISLVRTIKRERREEEQHKRSIAARANKSTR